MNERTKATMGTQQQQHKQQQQKRRQKRFYRHVLILAIIPILFSLTSLYHVQKNLLFTHTTSRTFQKMEFAVDVRQQQQQQQTITVGNSVDEATVLMIGRGNGNNHNMNNGDDGKDKNPMNDSSYKPVNEREGTIKPASRNTTRTTTTTTDHIPLCNREQIQNGAWVPTTLAAPPYVTRTTHLRCYSMATYKNGPWKTYEWQPAASAVSQEGDGSCEFTKWKRKTFCNLMERATVLIVGDSLSWEHYSSLAQLLGGVKVSQFDQHKSKLEQRNIIKYPCKGNTRIVFRRDDILSNLTGAIKETFPQILVLNRGAHYVNDTRLESELRTNVVNDIKNWKQKCQRLGVACHFFWRTTVPGHPKCDKKIVKVSDDADADNESSSNDNNSSSFMFTRPVNDIEQMEAWIANKSNYDNHTIHYHWYDYQRQNELAVNTLREELLLRFDNSEQQYPFDILDAYHLNIRRPDEHRSHQNDCLHNCYPGKMDVYNQLLLHFLKMRRTREDVSTLVDLFDKHENNNDGYV